MFKSVADCSTRLANGAAAFLDVLMDRGGITRDQAVRVLDQYRKLRVVKHQSISDGVISVKHGAFLDRDVIRRAAGLES